MVGQTGNFCLLAIRLFRGDWAGVLAYCLPICAFWCGVILTRHLLCAVFHGKEHRWRLALLIGELALFFCLGVFAERLPNNAANAFISFCAAAQFEGFRRMDGRLSYAPVFCTGNMRSCAEALYGAVFQRSAEERHRFFQYLKILAAFFAGCLLGAFCVEKLALKAVYVLSALYAPPLALLISSGVGEKSAEASAAGAD